MDRARRRSAKRVRLPGRRRFQAPRNAFSKVFLSGAKDGSGMAAILADAAVVISVALQCGIRAADLLAQYAIDGKSK